MVKKVPNRSKQNKIVVISPAKLVKRNKNKAKKLQVVVKQQKSGKPRMGKLVGKSKSLFRTALLNPFDPEVYGVRVPDPYPFPTQTWTSHGTTVLGSPTGFTSGSACFLPHPCISLLDLTNLDQLPSTARAVQSTNMSRLNATTTTTGNAIYGCASNSTMRSLMASYRVASWGIKISNLQPQLSATGRIIIAQLPIGDTVPTTYNLTNNTSANAVNGIFGVPSLYMDSGALLNLPTAIEIPVSNLVSNSVQVVGMYTSDSFFNFKTLLADNVLQGLYNEGDVEDFSSASALNAASFRDNTRMCGGTGIIVYFEGVPSGTANCIQVETIYHIEGQVSPGPTSGQFIPTATAPVIGSAGDVYDGIKATSSISKVVRFIKSGVDFARDNSDSFMSMARAIMAVGGGAAVRRMAIQNGEL